MICTQTQSLDLKLLHSSLFVRFSFFLCCQILFAQRHKVIIQFFVQIRNWLPWIALRRVSFPMDKHLFHTIFHLEFQQILHFVEVCAGLWSLAFDFVRWFFVVGTFSWWHLSEKCNESDTLRIFPETEKKWSSKQVENYLCFFIVYAWIFCGVIGMFWWSRYLCH